MTYTIQYTPKYFSPQELMPPELNANLWIYVFDPNILRLADIFRERFGTTIINNYAFGGATKYAGFREFNYPGGSKYSQHKFGRALDLKPTTMPNRRTLEAFFRNETDIASYIHIYNWGVHADTRNAIKIIG